jgi:hypothetical protein
VPRRANRTPKHRNDRPSLSRSLRHGIVATVAATGLVAGGVALAGEPAGEETAAAAALATVNGPATTPDADIAERVAESRETRSSRSAARAPIVQDKAALLRLEARPGPQESRSRTVELGDPRSIAQAMLGDHGWSQDQFSCLDSLWIKESGWDPTAANPTSSAYGIPQALPGSKMASAGADWETNPATQIEWGLGYIADRYGSPCAAWGHSQANGWY